MRLHELEKIPGKKRRKIVGRGTGSGHGKSSTYGNKGQKARSGGTKKTGFEGGQIPLYRRLPRQKGFKPLRKRIFYPVNLKELNRFSQGTIVTKSLLYDKGLIPSASVKIKILSDGELTKPLIVQAEAFSNRAKEKIEKSGGKAEVSG